MSCKTKTPVCFWLSSVVFVPSAWKIILELCLNLQWYHVDLGRLPEELCASFVAFHQDEETTEFLDKCLEKAGSIITQIFQSLVQTLLGFFMTKTSINGYVPCPVPFTAVLFSGSLLVY